MPQAQALQYFANNPLQPAYSAPTTELAVNIAPSTTLSKGTLLGQVTSSANDVQTLSVTNTPTSGSATVTGTNPLTGGTFTFAVVYNSTTAQAQTAIRAAFGVGATGVAVTGGSWPGTALIFTYTGSLAAIPIPVMTAVTNTLAGSGSTPVPSVAHTTIGRTANTYAAYSAAVAAAPGAPVLTGSGTAGVWPAGAHQVSLSGVNAQGETTLSPPSGITLTTTQSIHVAAQSSLDTTFTALNVYIDGMFAGTCACSAGTSTATDFAEPANTGVGSADKVKPVANTAYTIPNGAGTQTPLGILKFDVVTDSAGNIGAGTSTTGGIWGETMQSVPMYVEGPFNTADLTGLDAGAVSKLGRLVSGTTTSGVLKMF